MGAGESVRDTTASCVFDRFGPEADAVVLRTRLDDVLDFGVEIDAFSDAAATGRGGLKGSRLRFVGGGIVSGEGKITNQAKQ